MYEKFYWGGICVKRHGLIGLLLMVVCFVSGCSTYEKKTLLSELTSDDISQILVLSLKSEKMTKITESSEIEKVLTSIQELPLYAKSELNTSYSEELVQFTLVKSSGEEIVVEVQDPWISYNNVWYVCDTDICEQLSGLAYDLLP